jgi:hypothetical protein
MGTPIAVGSKLGIRCRWEQFSGIAKYCVGDDGGYLVGIQKDAPNRTTLDQLVSTAVPQREGVRSGDPPVSTAKVPNPQERQQSKRSGTAVAEGKPSKESIPRTSGRTAATPPPRTRDETESKGSPPEFDGPVRIELQTRQLSKEEENGKKRKHMRRNWFGLTHSRTKQDALNGNENGNGENGNRSPEVASPAGKMSENPKREDTPGFPIELMPVEDIYRTSGIRNPRKDYGINKVVEMLRSEHVRELPNEMKRAAVLMALDAAGIPIEEVLRDAKARQDALDSYEAERKTQIEAEWARKAKENAQILAELEGLKLHHMACINRNLDRMVREKATFSDWLAMKQQESQNISEAAALCLKSSASDPVPDSPPGNAVDASAKAAPVSLVAESREKAPR